MSTPLAALVKLLKERQAALNKENKKNSGPASTTPSSKAAEKKGP